MAVVLVILLLLLSTAVAAFSPDFSVFLACGAGSNISFPPSSSPARTFTPDTPFLTSSRGVQAITNANANSAASPLYAAARASSTSAFSYKIPYSSTAKFLVLRLHFFPFATSSSQPISISSARFTVSSSSFTLLSSFSPPPRAGVVKEFFVPSAVSSGEFRVTLTPDVGSTAFVNAVELFSAPPELLWNGSYSVTAVGANNDDVSLWRRQAVETVYRLNVGGPTVTAESGDTMWRTWVPDDPFLFGPPGNSVKNTTTSPINYLAGSSSDVAPEIVYKSQRSTNTSALSGFFTPGKFNVTWTFPLDDPRADYYYLVRLHFCDYELLSSVDDKGAVFDVFVAGGVGTPGLEPKRDTTMNFQAFYLDYVAGGLLAAGKKNLTVSIGMSDKSSPDQGGGFLNGLEIMKLVTSSGSSSSTGSTSDKKKVVIISVLSAVLGASVLAFSVLCFLLFLVRKRRQRQRARPVPEEKPESTQLPWSPYTQQDSWVNNQSSSQSGSGTSNGTRLHQQRVTMQQLHIPLPDLRAATDNFHDRNLIGVGGFGNVYRGALRHIHDGSSTTTRVAVKRAMRATKQGLPEFHTEILVLSAIRHRHLVSLVGYCNDNDEMILVYEYMEHGTLRSHLYTGDSSDQQPLTWKQRLEICIGAARGLHYLHTGHSDNIIHRDVKSTNILLGDNLIAKVADFGLSKIGPSYGQTHVSTAVKGSFGYLDPEYFKTQQLTDKSDVYSFGVVLFEVLCARPVIDQTAEDRDQVNLAEWALKWQRKGEVQKIVDPRIAGQVDPNSLRKFAETAAKCLADYGEERPAMGDVLWNLEYCLQLQETHVTREAFEDSGAAATQFPEDVVVPRWVPSSTSFFLTMDDDDDSSVVTDVAAANSKVFSQLSSSDGR